MSRAKHLHNETLYGDGSVIRRMQELVDTLAWIRIELALPAEPARSDTARQQRAVAKMDSALELAKQLVFDLDAQLRTIRDSGSSLPPE